MRLPPTTPTQRPEPITVKSQKRDDDRQGVLPDCYGSTILLRIAYRTSPADDERLSFRMMAARWLSTVFRLMLRMPLTSLLVCPSAISCSTLRSRLVRGDALPLPRCRNDSSSASVTFAEKKGLCEESASIASIKCRLASDLRR